MTTTPKTADTPTVLDGMPVLRPFEIIGRLWGTPYSVHTLMIEKFRINGTVYCHLYPFFRNRENEGYGRKAVIDRAKHLYPSGGYELRFDVNIDHSSPYGKPRDAIDKWPEGVKQD